MAQLPLFGTSCSEIAGCQIGMLRISNFLPKTQLQITICVISPIKFLKVPFATRILMNAYKSNLNNYIMKRIRREKNINELYQYRLFQAAVKLRDGRAAEKNFRLKGPLKTPALGFCKSHQWQIYLSMVTSVKSLVPLRF